MRILKSALFWRILLSSLLVVAVLGVGLLRANAAHEELEQQFERLVQHDLKLADDAEHLLRLMADLETGKRGGPEPDAGSTKKAGGGSSSSGCSCDAPGGGGALSSVGPAGLLLGPVLFLARRGRRTRA